ncbi:hypothetical protein GIB67_007683 [Kingdonia uniflora]|uniref:PI31 proteasome regulator N-terminal domain-containing protein n=1 Tax=Kingdonia uniflora TaxID=39325 RepID=A0A7J7N1Z3_9MAGN|nr:hypothetical protein GIB67_007683 [Kingdonia uniflora]
MATENTVLGVIRASRPTFRNAHDKVGFAVHATFLASGYELVATGKPAFAEDILSSPPTEEVSMDGWNETENNYGFVYAKNGGGKVFVLVTCLVAGDKLLVDALSSKDQDKEPISLQINVSEYDGENDAASYASQYENFSKLVKTLDMGILKKLEDSPATVSKSTAPSSGVYLPVQGDFDDLLPGPVAGVYPGGGPGFGGSMLVGPSDPRWFRPQQPGFPELPLGVPPGARFDPYGPPSVPGFEPNRFGRGPRRPGSHPDLEPFGNPDYI